MLNAALTVGAVVLGAVLLQFGNTLIAVLLPLRLGIAEVPGWVIGAVASAYGLGFLLGCRRAHLLIRQVGHIRTFAALAALCSIFALAFTENDRPWLWGAMRFAMGFCLAGLFIAAEGWLNAATPVRFRGRVMSLYLVGTKAAAIAGQMLLALGSVFAGGWFVLAGGVFSLALVPVALTRSPQPPVPRIELLGLRALARLAPAAIAGCLVAGLVNSAVINLLPAYGAWLAIPVALIVSLLSAMQVGSLLFQWPLGWLSDTIDRRYVIVACALAVAALSLLVPVADGSHPQLLFALFFLWGAVALSLYGLCVAHAADFAEPEQMVGVSGTALLAWATGSAIGPSLAAPLMDLAGPPALFIYAAALEAGLVLFVLWRIAHRAPRPPEERAPFVNVPATSPAIAAIDPRRPAPPEDATATRGDGDRQE